MSIVEKRVGSMNGKPLILRVNSKTQVSRENKVEYNTDKRVQELKKRGYSVGNIKAMLFSPGKEFSAKRIEQGLKARGVRLDGHV